MVDLFLLVSSNFLCFFLSDFLAFFQKKSQLKMSFATMHVNKMCGKHEKKDKCAVCNGFKVNWSCNYDEIYELYLGHLRHLQVYQGTQSGHKELYRKFIRRCQSQGFFENSTKFFLWTIAYDAIGCLFFSRVM